jgi:segregation and condensation protein A
MALSLAQNAIALLIELAERGEIDPWDVKVVEVIDRFLSQLSHVQPQKADRNAYESDLSESGQAFLYASILVLLKADSLARSESDEEDSAAEPEADWAGDDNEPTLPSNLERRLRRRAVAQPPNNRRVTLKELITQLELMAATVSDHRPRVRARRPRPQSRSQAVRTIAELAHQENLTEVAEALDRFLSNHWDAISQQAEWLEFDFLLGIWTDSAEAQATRQPNAYHSPQSDRVGVFWALLFLSAQSKVELSQDEFYQDLKVRSLATDARLDAIQQSAMALLD